MALGGIHSFIILSSILVVCIFVPRLANGQYRKLSAEEKIAFTKEFRLHNKPARKTIKTVHGERYSCVDFYRQPAFDHPLLRNHSYDYKATLSSVGEDPFINKNVSSKSTFKDLWANGKGCPPGTVPIRKYTKRQFIRAKLFQQQIRPMEDHPPGQYRSVVHTKIGTRDRYYGASGRISVYNLPVQDSQYTASYLALRSVDDSFQVGWMVNPFMYKDRETRIFLITRIGISQCFNTLCPGFVITNSDIPLDGILKPVSQRGASTYDYKFAIVRNLANNQWQLQLGDDNKVIGFWPEKILQGLAGPAEYAEWGGEAYSPTDTGGPGMGSGFFPSGSTKNDGYVSQLSIYYHTGEIAGTPVQMYSDNNNLYRVLDHGYVGDKVGHLATFGGPGPK